MNSSPAPRASPPQFPPPLATPPPPPSTMTSTASNMNRASSGQRNPISLTSGAVSQSNSSGNIVNPGSDHNHGFGRSGKSSGGRHAFGNAHGGGGNGARRRETPFNNPPPSQQGQSGGRARGKRGRNANFELTAEDETEVGSLFNSGGKKQNSLNHLLNFNYGTHENQHYNGNGNRRRGGNKGKPVNHYQPKYKKEQYLQANCQFTVHANAADYSPYLADPDLLVDWDCVEQVGLKTSGGVPSCPICLYPPTAAKIAKCGHVFCPPCILHYLALSDYPCRDCPICYVAIYREDLKSVVALIHGDFNTGSDVEMRLMRRERNSLFAVAVDKYDEKINEAHAKFGAENNSYSKLLMANTDQIVREIIDRERKELMDQYAAEKDQPESCFIEEALKMLAERESKLGTVKTESQPMNIKDNKATAASSGKESPKRHHSGSANGSPPTGATNKKETFYFYQSSDGQPLFLHALNFEMLVAEYGAPENCPRKISGKIMEKDSDIMTEQLRDKLRYLRHLPVTQNFEVCELDPKSFGLGKETLTQFEAQLEDRKKKRQRRAREEKRREKKIMIEEDKLMGKFPGAGKSLRIESEFHFPQVGRENAFIPASEFVPLNGTLSSDDYDEQGEHADVVDMASSASPPAVFAPESFASRIRSAPARKPTPTLTRSETFPSVSAPAIRNMHADSDEELPEGYVPPPPQASLGDSLAMAMASLSTGNQAGNGAGSGGKKGKKKFKGKTLSLTSR